MSANDENIMTNNDEQNDSLNGFLKNEDHIEFVGSILGDTFESEEEALDALSRIMVNGRRLTNIDDLEEAVRIIKEAILKNGIDNIKVEVNGSFQPVDYSLFNDDDEISGLFAPKKKKKKPGHGEKAFLSADAKEKAEAAPGEENGKASEEKPHNETSLGVPDMTDDIYTFTRPQDFDLKFDTFSDDFLDANVSGIVVLGRLSGIALSEESGKDFMERAADRLYVNGMPILNFFGMEKNEKLTEADYNTLGKNVAHLLKESFLDEGGKNFLMFKGEREDSFTAFTMGVKAVGDKPKEVKLFSGIRRALASKEENEKNREEYNDYIDSKLPRYEKLLNMQKISEEAKKAAAAVIPHVYGKVKKTSINDLQKERDILFNVDKPALTQPVVQKTENSLENEKEPQISPLGINSKRSRKTDDN